MQELTTRRQRHQAVPVAPLAKAAQRARAHSTPDVGRSLAVGASSSPVLFAYDGTASSGHAYGFACDLARNLHADLHVLRTVAVIDEGDDRPTEAQLARARRQCEKFVRTSTAGHRVAPHVEVAAGPPANEILQYAQRNNIAHIVLGYSRRARFSEWLFSVAREVTIFAPCTVTVVRS